MKKLFFICSIMSILPLMLNIPLANSAGLPICSEPGWTCEVAQSNNLIYGIAWDCNVWYREFWETDTDVYLMAFENDIDYTAGYEEVRDDCEWKKGLLTTPNTSYVRPEEKP